MSGAGRCTEHEDSVRVLRLRCGCTDYRCFECKRGMRVQCGGCGGGMRRLR